MEEDEQKERERILSNATELLFQLKIRIAWKALKSFAKVSTEILKMNIQKDFLLCNVFERSLNAKQVLELI